MTDAPAAPLRESDIRPSELMAEQVRLFAQDVARLVEKRAEFVTVACPACGAEPSVAEFDKAGIAYVSCLACQTIYANPRPSPALLQEYYETSENYRYWAQHIFPASEGARRDRIFRPRLDRVLGLCRRYQVDQDLLIEVGPGFGTFCALAKAEGGFDRVVGIEPTPWLAEECRRRGVEVVEQPIEEADLDRLPRPSVVAAFEVIEHLYQPSDFIEACAAVLPPGGLLVLTCPNGLGFEILVLREHSDTVDAEHLNYFNPDSLRGLVERNGLDVLEVSTPGQLDAELVRRKALEGVWDPPPFLRRVLFDEWDRVGGPFQDFLVAQQMSSHQWLVAQKPRD